MLVRKLIGVDVRDIIMENNFWFVKFDILDNRVILLSNYINRENVMGYLFFGLCY